VWRGLRRASWLAKGGQWLLKGVPCHRTPRRFESPQPQMAVPSHFSPRAPPRLLPRMPDDAQPSTAPPPPPPPAGGAAAGGGGGGARAPRGGAPRRGGGGAACAALSRARSAFAGRARRGCWPRCRAARTRRRRRRRRRWWCQSAWRRIKRVGGSPSDAALATAAAATAARVADRGVAGALAALSPAAWTDEAATPGRTTRRRRRQLSPRARPMTWLAAPSPRPCCRVWRPRWMGRRITRCTALSVWLRWLRWRSARWRWRRREEGDSDLIDYCFRFLASNHTRAL